MNFKLERKPIEPGVIAVRIMGSLDAHTFDRVEREVADIFASKTYRILFDLSQVDYMSSAGVGVFISACAEAERNEGCVVIACITHVVREVFDNLGLIPLFKIAQTQGEALQMLNVGATRTSQPAGKTRLTFE